MIHLKLEAKDTRPFSKVERGEHFRVLNGNILYFKVDDDEGFAVQMHVKKEFQQDQTVVPYKVEEVLYEQVPYWYEKVIEEKREKK